MNKAIAKEIVERLSHEFTDKPALKFNSPFELLVAVILSAQCTDERVNKVTSVLFEKYSTPEQMLTLKKEELERYIYSCGFYKVKAEHILYTSRDIIEKFTKAIQKGLDFVNSNDEETVAKSIKEFFPDTSLDDLVKVIKRYKEIEVWPTTTEFKEDSFNHLQDIMISAYALEEKVPYSDLIYKK